MSSSKNSNYWDGRIAENILDKSTKEGLEKLTNLYQEQAELVKNKVISLYADLTEYGEISSTKLYEYDRLKNTMAEINKALKKYGEEEIDIINHSLENAFLEVIELAEQNTDISFSAAREEMLETVLNTKFMGKHFSSRVWDNKNKLVNLLEKTVQKCVGSGFNKDRAVTEIMEKCDSSFSNADRLIRTETMRAINDSQKEIYKAENRTHGYYIYAKDSRVCDYCKKISEDTKKNPIPLDELVAVHHPNCRCTFVPKVSLATNVDNNKNNIINTNNSKNNKPKDLKEENKNDKIKYEKLFDNIDNKEYAEKLLDRLESGSPTAKAVYKKYIPIGGAVDDDKYSNGAYYSPRSNSIKMSFKEDEENKRGNGSTWFHEHGHYLDYNTGGESYNPKFTKAIKSDVKNLENEVKKKYNVKLSEAREIIGKEFVAIGRVTHSLQDIFGGTIKKRYPNVMYCHEAKYWKAMGNQGVGVEAFAHMFEALFSKEKQELMQKYLPSAWEYFNKVMEGL